MLPPMPGSVAATRWLVMPGSAEVAEVAGPVACSVSTRPGWVIPAMLDLAQSVSTTVPLAVGTDGL
jgi:hypothetical protein